MDVHDIVKQLSELYGFDYNEGLILIGLNHEEDKSKFNGISLKRRGRGRPRNENKEMEIRVDTQDPDIEEIEVRRIITKTGEMLLESANGTIYSETTLEMIGRRVSGEIVLLDDL
tara:strand:+ start:332 stop:676 length:345 start_codon:yes stop_codon:yes gene_type:complete